MKKYLLPIFAFLFFIFSISIINAQTPTIVSADNANVSQVAEVNNFTIKIISPKGFKDPEALQSIDESVEKIEITFPDAPKGAKIRLCLNGDSCIPTKEVRDKIQGATPDGLTDLISDGLKPSAISSKKLVEKPFDGKSFTICAANENDLKTDCEDESKNYFWAGRTYHITLYEETDDNWLLRRKAGIYINHHSPIVEVIPLNNKAPEKFKVTLYQDFLSKNGDERYNNFQVVVNGAAGYKQERCIPQDAGGFKKNSSKDNPYSLVFPFKEDAHLFKGGGQAGNGLTNGKYTILINEQVDEGRKITLPYGGSIGGNNCGGGFTFFKYECFVPADNQPNQKTLCSRAEDPNKSDLNNLMSLLDEIGIEKQSVLPCKEGLASPGILNCKEIDTAIGPIKLDVTGFITRLFQIVLAIGSLGAFALIIYAGYKLLVSRGNKEIIQGARETLTSAILGLLFIIFSLVILSIITGGILRLPGFN